MSVCPALTDFCKNEKRASLIFDTNWHALCNSEECESLPRFPISPPVRSISEIRKVNSKCTLKPFYMQKDTPPQNFWSDCYIKGGEMKKEADGAWTLTFPAKYTKGTNCSAEVKRNEMMHWSVKGVSICVFVVRKKHFFGHRLRLQFYFAKSVTNISSISLTYFVLNNRHHTESEKMFLLTLTKLGRVRTILPKLKKSRQVLFLRST